MAVRLQSTCIHVCLRVLITLITILLYVYPVVCHAEIESEVEKVWLNPQILTLSQPQLRPYREEDYICIYNEYGMAACGWVIISTPKEVVISLAFKKHPIEEGDEARLTLSRTNLISQEPNSLIDLSNQLKRRQRNFSISAGINYLYPTLHYEQALGYKFSIGFSGLYQKYEAYGVQASSYGAQISFNLYGTEHFHGFWIHGAGGLFRTSLEYDGASGSFYSEGVTGLVGWKFLLSDNINLSVGFGAQLFRTKTNGVLPFNFTTIQPTATIQ